MDTSKPSPLELDTLTLVEIAESLDSGLFTVAELTAAHLEQIRKWNPTLRAVIDINPDAMGAAAALDAELAASRRR